MSWLSDFFKGGKNPADAAMPYLDQIAPMEHAAYDPYIQRGNEASNTLMPQFNQMSSDPAAFLESLMKNYQPSRGYQLQNDEMRRSAGNTAAAGGMRGSLNDISNEARISDTLMGNDMQQWLKNVLGIETAGQGGLQHTSDQGFNATQGMTGDLSNVLGTQGTLAFQGQANQNKSLSDLLSGLLKGVGTVGGWDSPSGGTVGSNFINRFI